MVRSIGTRLQSEACRSGSPGDAMQARSPIEVGRSLVRRPCLPLSPIVQSWVGPQERRMNRRENGDDVELREVLAALRASWWLALAGLLIGAAAALLASLLQTPLYTSSTQLFVSTRDSASSADVFQGSQFSQQ